MSLFRNNTTLLQIREALGLQQATDKIPIPIPVVEVNPRLLRQCNIVKANQSTGATVTVYTTPSDRDFYICAATLSFQKDAASTCTYSSLTITIDGTSVSLLRVTGIASTVQNDSVTISLPFPLKIDRGTNIQIAHAVNSATVQSQATIIGFTLDPS